MFKKHIALVLTLSMVVGMLIAPERAKAWPSVATTGAGAAAGAAGDVGIFSQLGTQIGQFVEKNWQAMTLTASKMAALFAVQKFTAAIIGSGNGGSISDYNQYLFISPQQKAMTQMNSFFNTVSRGRLSTLNYEGMGMNYDAYLVSQARKAIGGQNFSTNLQEQVSDPTQTFANGNMKGIMTYMQCANNPMCYTLVSTAKYNSEFTKAQEIAKAEQDRGFLPQKKNGKIIKPAALLSAVFTQVDQLGTETIMSANVDDGLPAGEMQIAQGVLMNLAARSLNYATSDASGRAAVRNQNDQFPFSLSYNIKSGGVVSANGVSTNIGGAIINNTCDNKYNTQKCCTYNGGKWVNNTCTN